jgi:hypothetical protein
VQGLTELLDTIEDFHKRLPFGPVFYYDYGNVVDDGGNFRPIAKVLSDRAGHWERLMSQMTSKTQTQSAGDWATQRDSTAQEQQLIDYFRQGGSSWSLQLDFHDRAKALALFEPVTDDVSWLKSCRLPQNEIDIAEAHFPKDIHCTLHDWHKPPRIIRRILYHDHLADAMNDYGLLWLPDRLIWTLNGKAMFTVESKIAAVPAEIRFSTAVGDDTWGWGKTDDPTDTEMDVYWVRVAPLKDDPKQQ